MKKAKMLVIDAEEIAKACGLPVHKVQRDRAKGMFDFQKLSSVSIYIGMMRAKKELNEAQINTEKEDERDD